jgi:isochorismate pyruvate lyase
MKAPGDCRSLAEVRAEIDQIDEQIVALLGLRAGYVHAAAGFKNSQSEVVAPGRQATMMKARRDWACRQALDPDFIERLFREIVTYFVAREMEHL